MSEITTEYSEKAFKEAKGEAQVQSMIAEVMAAPDNVSAVKKARLLVKQQIAEELKTIKDEQFAITKRKAEEYIASGINRKSELWPLASIHPRAYYRWERAVPGCWEDKEFFNEYLRDNPEADLRAYIKRHSNILAAGQNFSLTN